MNNLNNINNINMYSFKNNNGKEYLPIFEFKWNNINSVNIISDVSRAD